MLRLRGASTRFFCHEICPDPSASDDEMPLRALFATLPPCGYSSIAQQSRLSAESGTLVLTEEKRCFILLASWFASISGGLEGTPTNSYEHIILWTLRFDRDKLFINAQRF